MKYAIRGPLPHFLNRLPAVLDELVVDDVDLAIRSENDDGTWNRFDDHPRLALAQRLARSGYLLHVTPPLRTSTESTSSVSRMSSCRTPPARVQPARVPGTRVAHTRR